MKPLTSIRNLAAVIAATLVTPLFFTGQAGAASTPYPMVIGNYSETFFDMTNWPAGLGGTSTTASNWAPVAVTATGTIGDGVKTTTSTATFSTSMSGGLQTNSPTGSMALLSTGSTDNSAAVAVDLLLDFTGRNAGTLSFDWAQFNNSTGNRAGSLKVFTSIDGTTWTELTAAFISVSNNFSPVAAGTMSAITLPAAFNGSSAARIRFYEFNGTGGGPGTLTGSRPKISIDNIVVTQSTPGGAPPVITSITPSSIAANAGDTAAFTVTATGDAANYRWYKETASSTNQIITATTPTLTLANVLAADIAGYQVVLSNASGMATSSVVTLTVVDPFIISQPVNQSGLVAGSVSFAISVGGTSLGYQWFVKPTADSDFTGMSPLTTGGRILGATTQTLTITNLAYTDSTNLFVVVTNSLGTAVTSSVVTLTVANAASVAFWDFNGYLNITNPAVALGFGKASFTNCTTFSNGVSFASGNDFGANNNAWGTSTYPTNGNAANNKTGGVRFNASTLGAKNISVTYDTKASGTASKYERLQYTTNGIDFIDYPTSSSFIGLNYESRSFSLVGFQGVQNNTNFAIRIVAEYESTAKYGATNDAQYVGNGGTYTPSSGTLSYDLVNIKGEAITNANTPPTISVLTNMSTTDTSAATSQSFTVGDAQTAAGSLTVTAVSYNTTVMPSGNVTFGGSGANRTLSITPVGGAVGVAPVLLTVTDGDGDTTVAWFYVTVIAGNQPPTISGLVNTNALGNVTNTFAFTVGDVETPAGSLTVTASSGNATLVPNDISHISFGGSGANRTISIASVANQYGVTPITVSVFDGNSTTALTFALELRPNTILALNEGFDYDSSGAIINVSSGFWQNHSGTVGQMQVGSGVVTVTDANAEDVNAPLLGQPYTAASGQVLYSSFTLNFSALPTATNSYFAHFKDNSSSGFYGRVYASTFSAGPSSYRIGVGNASANGSPGQIAQDLLPGVDYTIITRLVLSNGVCTIWINPASEASPSATDNTLAGPTSAITSYALREAVGEGTLTIDNLKVGPSFISVVSNVVDVAPQANPDATSVVANSSANSLSPLTNDVLNTVLGSLSIASVSPTNGTATISGTNVLFTPTASFAGTATIGYTITDGFGGTSTSLITIAVAAPASIPLNLSVAGSSLTFNWADPTFSLQSSTNVAGPYTTIPGATTGFSTNTTAAPTMFFRLKF